jgi:hypothetical protein
MALAYSDPSATCRFFHLADKFNTITVRYFIAKLITDKRVFWAGCGGFNVPTSMRESDRSERLHIS